MSIKSLLAKLTDLLNKERHVQIEKHKSLKKILKALRREKKALEESLAETGDSEQMHNIEARLKIVSAQRKKGLEVLKDLKRTDKQG